MGYGLWIVDCGLWIMDYGLWIMDHGSWIMVHGSWIMDYGLWICLLDTVYLSGVCIPVGCDYGVRTPTRITFHQIQQVQLMHIQSIPSDTTIIVCAYSKHSIRYNENIKGISMRLGKAADGHWGNLAGQPAVTTL